MRIGILVHCILGYGLTAFCQAQSNIGDIVYDPARDDPQFQLCNPARVVQGYELRSPLDESRRAIGQQIQDKFSYRDEWAGQTGYVTVRFIVNCYGLADRFRETSLTADLQQATFPGSLTNYLRSIVKEVSWPPGRHGLKTYDYYHYVTFKIINGKLEHVIQ